MTREIQVIVDAALEGRKLLEHPFYRRWEAGGLELVELKGYADQYRHFETELPSILSEVAAQLPTGPTRRAVEDNFEDEVSPPSHLTLFEQFAQHYGATGSKASPAMEGLVSAYRACVREGTTSALAGILAYEVQGAGVARTKASGLTEHYSATEDATAFWRLHADVEGDHATWLLQAVDVDDATAAASGAVRVAAAWWRFLDEREELAA